MLYRIVNNQGYTFKAEVKDDQNIRWCLKNPQKDSRHIKNKNLPILITNFTGDPSKITLDDIKNVFAKAQNNEYSFQVQKYEDRLYMVFGKYGLSGGGQQDGEELKVDEKRKIAMEGGVTLLLIGGFVITAPLWVPLTAAGVPLGLGATFLTTLFGSAAIGSGSEMMNYAAKTDEEDFKDGQCAYKALKGAMKSVTAAGIGAAAPTGFVATVLTGVGAGLASEGVGQAFEGEYKPSELLEAAAIGGVGAGMISAVNLVKVPKTSSLSIFKGATAGGVGSGTARVISNKMKGEAWDKNLYGSIAMGASIGTVISTLETMLHRRLADQIKMQKELEDRLVAQNTKDNQQRPPKTEDPPTNTKGNQQEPPKTEDPLTNTKGNQQEPPKNENLPTSTTTNQPGSIEQNSYWQTFIGEINSLKSFLSQIEINKTLAQNAYNDASDKWNKVFTAIKNLFESKLKNGYIIQNNLTPHDAAQKVMEGNNIIFARKHHSPHTVLAHEPFPVPNTNIFIVPASTHSHLNVCQTNLEHYKTLFQQTEEAYKQLLNVSLKLEAHQTYLQRLETQQTCQELETQLQDLQQVRQGLEIQLQDSQQVRQGLEIQLQDSQQVRQGPETQLQDTWQGLGLLQEESQGIPFSQQLIQNMVFIANHTLSNGSELNNQETAEDQRSMELDLPYQSTTSSSSQSRQITEDYVPRQQSQEEVLSTLKSSISSSSLTTNHFSAPSATQAREYIVEEFQNDEMKYRENDEKGTNCSLATFDDSDIDSKELMDMIERYDNGFTPVTTTNSNPSSILDDSKALTMGYSTTSSSTQVHEESSNGEKITAEEQKPESQEDGVEKEIDFSSSSTTSTITSTQYSSSQTQGMTPYGNQNDPSYSRRKERAERRKKRLEAISDIDKQLINPTLSSDQREELLQKKQKLQSGLKA